MLNHTYQTTTVQRHICKCQFIIFNTQKAPIQEPERGFLCISFKHLKNIHYLYPRDIVREGFYDDIFSASTTGIQRTTSFFLGQDDASIKSCLGSLETSTVSPSFNGMTQVLRRKERTKGSCNVSVCKVFVLPAYCTKISLFHETEGAFSYTAE